MANVRQDNPNRFPAERPGYRLIPVRIKRSMIGTKKLIPNGDPLTGPVYYSALKRIIKNRYWGQRTDIGILAPDGTITPIPRRRTAGDKRRSILSALFSAFAPKPVEA